MPLTIVREGLLFKQSEHVKIYRSRWIIVTHSSLMTVDPEEQVTTAVLLFTEQRPRVSTELSLGALHGDEVAEYDFTVSVGVHELKFRAASKRERELWCLAIADPEKYYEAIEKAKREEEETKRERERRKKEEAAAARARFVAGQAKELRLGDRVPDFTLQSTNGELRFHSHIAKKWCLLIILPGNFLGVCSTELAMLAKRGADLSRRGLEVVVVSPDDLTSHKAWIHDINTSQHTSIAFPIVSDPLKEVAIQYGVVDESLRDARGPRLAPCRACFLIAPNRRVEWFASYPASTGINVDEILRCVDSLQLSIRYSIATPANWKRGKDCLVPASLGEDAEKELFPTGVRTVVAKSGRTYLRVTSQPKPKAQPPPPLPNDEGLL